MSLILPLGIMTMASIWFVFGFIKMIFTANDFVEFICNIIGTILFVYIVIWVLT
jgi:hypothetical protein